MLAFRSFLQRKRKAIEKDEIHDAMLGVPSIVIDSLISRFTEVARGSTKCVPAPVFAAAHGNINQ